MDEQKFLSNGIIRSKMNELVCCLCTTSEKITDFTQHLENPSHVNTLRQFKLIFVEKDEKVHCKGCDEEMDWWQVKNHAEWHKIIPWYVVPLKYKIFFENRILQLNDGHFHCFPCKFKFSDWSQTVSHVSDEEHKKIIENEPPIHDTFHPLGVTYKFLVEQGFEPWGATTVKCKICNCPNIPIKNVKLHSDEEDHTETMKTFQSDFPCPGSAPKDNGTAKIAKQPGQKFAESMGNLEKNFTNDRRAHRSGNRSMDRCSNVSARRRTPSFHSNNGRFFDHSKTKKTYPVVDVDGILHCTVCDCKVSTSSEEHGACESHLANLKRYGYEHMESIDGFSFRCNICKCKVPNLENVFRHIKGVKHRATFDHWKNSISQEKKFTQPTQNLEKKNNPPEEKNNNPQEEKKENVSKNESSGKKENSEHGKVTNFKMNFPKQATNIRQNVPNLPTHNGMNFPPPPRMLYPIPPPLMGMNFPPQMGINFPHYPAINVPMQVPTNYIQPAQQDFILGGSKDLGKSQKPMIPTKDFEGLFTANIAIVKIGNTDFCCKICYALLSDQTTIDSHLKGKEHYEAAKICGNRKIQEEGKYYCAPCRYVIPNFENVMLHSISNKHREKTGIPKDGPAANKILPGNLKISSKSFIFRTSTNNFFCYICEIPLENIDIHVEDAAHKSVYEKYDFRCIEVICENKYKCVYCDCSIRSFQNLRVHLSEETHSTGIANAIGPLRSTDREISNLKNPEEIGEETKQSKKMEAYEEFINSVSKKPSESNQNEKITSIDQSESTTPSMETNKNDNSVRPRRVPKSTVRTAANKEKSAIIDLESIYNMKEKLLEIEKAIALSRRTDTNDIYCLICKKNINCILKDYPDHFWTLEHCQTLEELENDDSLFLNTPEQFSELALAKQFMTEIEEDIRCHVCNVTIENNDFLLKNHMDQSLHEELANNARSEMRDLVPIMNTRTSCDWFNIFQYSCQLCLVTFSSDVKLVQHLASYEHSCVLKSSENLDKIIIYDFCSPCGILWYGFRKSYALHCELSSHKSHVRDEENLSPKLPTSAKCLLAMWKMYIKDSIDHLDGKSLEEKSHIESLIIDLEGTAKTEFPNAKARVFGTYVAGLNSHNHDLQIFLDCVKINDAEISKEEQISNVRKEVAKCLRQNSNFTSIQELRTQNDVISIKTIHVGSGIYCELFFDNKEDVESGEVIKLINDTFPQSREMIIFLIEWLNFSGLFGTEIITSKALCWYVIFYLQQRSIVPAFINFNEKSNPVQDTKINLPVALNGNGSSDSSTKELLIGFFKFYANFDYRREVVSPLMGKALKKESFANEENLPVEIAHWIDPSKKSLLINAFYYGSTMSLQNPIRLEENLTKMVKKIHLNRFRIYCSKSADILETSDGS